MPGPSSAHVWALGLSCGAPAALGPRERFGEERILRREREKKSAKFWAPPTLRVPTLRVPTLLGNTIGNQKKIIIIFMITVIIIIIVIIMWKSTAPALTHHESGPKRKALMVCDVSRAFCYAPVQHEKHVELCEEAKKTVEDKSMCAKLRMSMCGTKAAAQNWQKKVQETMATLDFLSSPEKFEMSSVWR